jgi:NAD(P)H-hydrate epimerase
VATRAEYANVLTAAQPELMCRAVEHQTDLSAVMQSADVVAIGPGLGQDAWAREMLGSVLQSKLPLVLDADALNLLAEEPIRCEHWVLTPHPGEAARLLDTRTTDIQSNRPASALQLQQRYGGVIVLKGAGTWVQGDSQAQLCPYGNPGMAVGGMGDVLTGILAAFIAQRLSLEQAASAGVLTHALAGDVAAQAGQRGLLPTDLIAELRAIVNP